MTSFQELEVGFTDDNETVTLTKNKTLKAYIQKQKEGTDESILAANKIMKTYISLLKDIENLSNMITICKAGADPQKGADAFLKATIVKYQELTNQLNINTEQYHKLDKPYKNILANVYNDKDTDNNVKQKLATILNFQQQIQKGGSSSSQSTRPAPLFYN